MAVAKMQLSPAMLAVAAQSSAQNGRIRNQVLVAASLSNDRLQREVATPSVSARSRKFHLSRNSVSDARSRNPVVHSSALDAALPGGGDGGDGGSGLGGGGGGGDGSGAGESGSGKDFTPQSLAALFAKGWQERVQADSQFPFKVLTEQVIGVGASVVGDMASRPNFGLNELDFVFSTLVVGSIVNFSLMYLLSPVVGEGDPSLPGIFRNCPPGHMFEPGKYTALERAGTYVYKAVQFGGVGFLAGLFGTAVSSTLLLARQTFQPGFTLQNDPPPTFLNAATWGLQLAFSSNLRYQCLNGLDQILVPIIPASVFRILAFILRSGNNVVGGFSFVTLARITGAQPKEAKKSGEDAPLVAA